jgi:drug/metabolite transporter (DMT)-like permease
VEKPGARGVGAALGFVTVVMWGTQFTVTKVLFRNLDAFAVTSLRYGFGGAILAGILGVAEGRKAFRMGEHARRAWLLGPAGVVGSVLLAYYGLQHTRPQNAALMVALQPLIMAILLRVTGKGILPRSTAVAMAVAFVGAIVVIAEGDPRTFVQGGIGWGVILCFFGQFSWVIYTAELPRFTGWSILRTTTLTTATGGVAVVGVFGIALLAGVSNPDFGALGSDWGYVVWMVLGPTVAAIFAWNKGRMLLGAQDIALFMYLIPVVAFVSEAVRGYHPNAIEAAAAVVVVAALAGDNIVQRRARANAREELAAQTAPTVPH